MFPFTGNMKKIYIKLTTSFEEYLIGVMHVILFSYFIHYRHSHDVLVAGQKNFKYFSSNISIIISYWAVIFCYDIKILCVSQLINILLRGMKVPCN